MIVQESLARDVLRLFIWYPFRWFCLVAPIGLNYRLFALMGRVHYRLSKNRSKELGKLFRNAFPEAQEAEVNGWIQDYFVNHYIDRMSIFHYHRLHSGNLAEVIEFDGLDLLNETLKLGSGCLLIHGHVGPSQLPLVALGVMGYPMTQIGFRTDAGLSFIGRNVQLRHRLKIEEQFPAEMLYADKFQRQVFRSLASGRIIMIAGDGSGNENRFGQQSRRRFLEQQMDFPLGPFRLAKKSRQPVLFLFLNQDRQFHYRVRIEKPVAEPEQKGPVEETVLQDAFMAQLNRCISADPGQWQFWDQFFP